MIIFSDSRLLGGTHVTVTWSIRTSVNSKLVSDGIKLIRNRE